MTVIGAWLPPVVRIAVASLSGMIWAEAVISTFYCHRVGKLHGMLLSADFADERRWDVGYYTVVICVDLRHLRTKGMGRFYGRRMADGVVHQLGGMVSGLASPPC
jgi:hypothetical protein